MMNVDPKINNEMVVVEVITHPMRIGERKRIQMDMKGTIMIIRMVNKEAIRAEDQDHEEGCRCLHMKTSILEEVAFNRKKHLRIITFHN